MRIMLLFARHPDQGESRFKLKAVYPERQTRIFAKSAKTPITNQPVSTVFPHLRMAFDLP
jgi:hypothetical protein